jgi:hypothetical protein
MKSAAEKLYLQTFFQRSRDHLLQESSMKNTLYVDEAFVSGRALPPEKRRPAEAQTPAVTDASVDPKFKRTSVTSALLRTFLKSGLILAAIVLLPGALIGAPLLWWLGHRRKAPPQPTWKECS